MLLRLWFLWLFCGFLLLRGCCLRHGMLSFRLRAYLVLFLAGSRDLVSSERCPGVCFRRHKQMFGGLRPRSENSQKITRQLSRYRVHIMKSQNYSTTFIVHETPEDAFTAL